MAAASRGDYLNHKNLIKTYYPTVPKERIIEIAVAIAPNGQIILSEYSANINWGGM